MFLMVSDTTNAESSNPQEIPLVHVVPSLTSVRVTGKGIVCFV